MALVHLALRPWRCVNKQKILRRLVSQIVINYVKFWKETVKYSNSFWHYIFFFSLPLSSVGSCSSFFFLLLLTCFCFFNSQLSSKLHSDSKEQTFFSLQECFVLESTVRVRLGRFFITRIKYFRTKRGCGKRCK